MQGGGHTLQRGFRARHAVLPRRILRTRAGTRSDRHELATALAPSLEDRVKERVAFDDAWRGAK
jgi:hypothetical protein